MTGSYPEKQGLTVIEAAHEWLCVVKATVFQAVNVCMCVTVSLQRKSAAQRLH